MHHMESVDEFSMHDLHGNMVIPAYMHDGSENDFDQFQFKITDGKHTMMKTLVNIFFMSSVILLKLNVRTWLIVFSKKVYFAFYDVLFSSPSFSIRITGCKYT